MNQLNNFNSKPSPQTVGASLQSSSNSAGRNNNQDKSSSSRNSSMAPSDEFLAFWGENVDSSWFEGKRFISPFIVIIVLLTLLTFYLCGHLLFSQGEIEQIFFASTSPSADTTAPVSIDESAIEEKTLIQAPEFNDVSNKKEAAPKTPNVTPQLIPRVKR